MKKILLVSLLGLLFTVLESSKVVEKINKNGKGEVDKYYDNNDSEMYADTLVKLLNSESWVKSFVSKHGRKPIIIIDSISVNFNKPYYYDGIILVSNIESLILKDGIFTLKSFGFYYEKLQNIKRNKISADSLKKALDDCNMLAKRIKYDYFFTGKVDVFIDEKKGNIYHTLNFHLVDVNTHRKILKIEKRFIKLP